MAASEAVGMSFVQSLRVPRQEQTKTEVSVFLFPFRDVVYDVSFLMLTVSEDSHGADNVELACDVQGLASE